MRQATTGAAARGALRILLVPAAVAAISGCVPTAGSGTGSDVVAAPPEPGTTLLERDVEAPEIFAATDSALWDGRPSLGGIWVAAPDVTDPERVLMRNPANGMSVVGALFRRERITPGPALQLSSEAAVALGILAGAPTEIAVVALREAEAPAVTPGLAVPPPEGAAADAVDPATPAAAPAPARPGLFARLFRRAPAAAAPAPSAVAAAPSGPTPVQRPARPGA